MALSADTADFLLRAGQKERAHAVVERATNLAQRDRRLGVTTLIKLAVAVGQSGQRDDAARLIHRAEQAVAASDGYARVLDLAEVAEGLHHTGRPAERDELLRRVLHESRTLADPAERAEGLRRVAEAFGRTGNPDGAVELAQEILSLAGTAHSPSRRHWDTYAVAGALLAAGDIDAVLGLEGSLPKDAVHEILTGVVKRLVDAGDRAAAELITNRQADERALGYSAAGAAATGDVTRAMADALTVPEHRGKALAAIAQSLGPCPQGHLVLVEALCWGPWEQVTEEITGVVPEHLPLLADLVPAEG
ncbi:hypothetical protein NGM36_36075 [Streptomyces mutabilis]|uniref:hypothetical protein n=1 Tax=Streptomyces mutabilis TaxID=67332 RepID=UPI0022BA4F51|nr:hypothetical protein [Streptomyces mutabilis]MCZ9355110.1 hypothetical protein [Streptomyces mutabilis]